MVTAVKKQHDKGTECVLFYMEEFVKASLMGYLSRDQKEVREQAAGESVRSAASRPVPDDLHFLIHALCRPLPWSVTSCLISKENRADVKDNTSNI